MDSTTLEEITKTIIEKLHDALGAAVEVTPVLLRNDKEGVGFHLFHVQENSNYRNYPSIGKDAPPVNFTPMALNLFYQLSANSQEHEKENIYNEQRWMSTAMKALHDHAIIRKTIPLPEFPDGKDIDIKITLQTLTPSESVQYWAAAESPVRLSAYYEVSVVFLEPEKPTSYAGRVLSYGNFIFLKTPLQITASHNTIEYILPTDLSVNQVTVQPAQAPASTVLAVGDPIPMASVVRFSGTGFNTGSIKVLLISRLWDKPEVPDVIQWQIEMVSENQIDILIQETTLPGGTINVIPGLYAVQLQITKKFILPNGTTKDIQHLSNQFPFSVMPRIDSVTARAGAPGVFDITGYCFEDSEINEDDIQVYIGEIKLINDTPGLPQYQVTNSRTMNVNVPAEISGPNLPLRILIRGIESEPRWISIP